MDELKNKGRSGLRKVSEDQKNIFGKYISKPEIQRVLENAKFFKKLEEDEKRGKNKQEEMQDDNSDWSSDDELQTSTPAFIPLGEMNVGNKKMTVVAVEKPKTAADYTREGKEEKESRGVKMTGDTLKQVSRLKRLYDSDSDTDDEPGEYYDEKYFDKIGSGMFRKLTNRRMRRNKRFYNI